MPLKLKLQFIRSFKLENNPNNEQKERKTSFSMEGSNFLKNVNSRNIKHEWPTFYIELLVEAFHQDNMTKQAKEQTS